MGELAGLWRYRVGDIRILARLEFDRLVVFVVEIGNRREVYRWAGVVAIGYIADP